MCRKAGEIGLITTPLNPEAKPWKPTGNPVLPSIANKTLVNYYYPHYHFHYTAASGLMHQYPPPPFVAHPNYYHDQKRPLKEVSSYNVPCKSNPDRDTTQKGYPRSRGKWMFGGCGHARKIGTGGGQAKEAVTHDCNVGLRSAVSNKARWSGYNEKTKFDIPKSRGRRSVCENGRGQYVPKKITHCSNGGDVQVVSVGTAPADDDGAGGVKRTTVMIRNIPNKFRRGMLMCFLDKYCLELNLEYDFVYLPMDFKTLDNFGYAFVNFTSASAATKIMNTLSNYKWGLVPSRDGTLVDCKKICQVTWAKSQGKEDLARRFMNTFFNCDSYDFLPVILNPPCNGSNSDSVTVTPVGKCRQLLVA